MKLFDTYAPSEPRVVGLNGKWSSDREELFLSFHVLSGSNIADDQARQIVPSSFIIIDQVRPAEGLLCLRLRPVREVAP